MSKVRKMLGKADSPYIVSLMRLIETQSKNTIVKWCNDYAREHVLPIYEKDYPEDSRLKNSLNAVNEYLEGNIKLTEAKKVIKEVQVAAREAEGNHAAQAAARAIGATTTTINTITSSLGLAFYGAAAIAYSSIGVNANSDVYDEIASIECKNMEDALRKVAIIDEPNPAKINWYC
ncbi:putative immunity protein [Clostridium sp.]|uniref:putative immunity protein n=1 Tax=Clostridium sp. TaxID=1506 RepID=UPI0025C0BE39|nr:Imm5 family immunity protein [Clostridium sp.]